MKNEIANRLRMRVTSLMLIEDIVRQARSNLSEHEYSVLSKCIEYAKSAEDADEIAKPITRIAGDLTRAAWNLDVLTKSLLSDIEALEGKEC